MKYVFRKHPSKLATLMVTFGAGARAEWKTQYPNGIAHYLEHVRFKGTETKTAKDLLKETANAGGSWNAWTSEDLVSYHMNIPEENIEVAFKCLADITFRPAFPEEELEKEKEVVCQEVRMYLDDIDYLVGSKLYNVAFNNARTLSILGTEESVTSISRQNVLDFNKEFYSNEHMLISLGANNSHDHLVEKYFGISDGTLLYKPKDENVEYQLPSEHEVHKEGQLQDSIQIAYGNKDLRDLVVNERAKIKVFSTIFGQSDTSRLFLSVREDLGLVYGIGSMCDDGMDGSLYTIYTSTEPENRDLVLETIQKEIDKIVNEMPLEEEVERAKNVIRSAYYRMMDSSSSAIRTVLNQEFFGHNSDAELLVEIDQVTTEDVNCIAKKIFAGNRYQIIGTGK